MSEELLDAYTQMEEALQSAALHEDFIGQFYTMTSGTSAVVMIAVILYIILDFLRLRQPLLCGYSRTEVYLAKLAGSVVFAVVYLAIMQLVIVFLGVCFYGSVLDGPAIVRQLQILLMQCLGMLPYIAVYCATAFCFGNAWAFLASSLIFTVPAAIPLVLSIRAMQPSSMLFSAIPSFIGVSGMLEYQGFDQMLVNPSLWTGPMLGTAAAISLGVVVAATALGLRVFQNKDM